MRKYITLDTNLVLRLLVRDVPSQVNKIINLIDHAGPESLAVPDVVFFECAWILAGSLYQFDRSLIGKLILTIADIPQINCNRAMLERAVPLYIKHASISFIDACLVTYAELNSATPLVTFDKKLAKALPKMVKVL